MRFEQKILKLAVISITLSIAACAGNRVSAPSSSDYVEVENPTATMSPGAPATIWVPRSSVESGIPRGGELLKMGAEQVVQSIRGSSGPGTAEGSEQQAAAAGMQATETYSAPRQPPQAPSYPPPPSEQRQPALSQQPYYDRMQPPRGEVQAVRNRVAIVGTDGSRLVKPLAENLRRAAVVGIFDPGQTAFLAQSQNLASDADKAAFAIRLQQDYGVNVVIYLSAPDGVAAGKEISADVYDALGGGLLQRFADSLPVQPEGNWESVSLPQPLTGKIGELLSFLPWYGRIVAVQGNRAYVAAGKEAGLQIGQSLKIYKTGRFMKGLGFAPGEQVGTLTVQGFVGPNGSFCVVREGAGVEANDIVAVE